MRHLHILIVYSVGRRDLVRVSGWCLHCRLSCSGMGLEEIARLSCSGCRICGAACGHISVEPLIVRDPTAQQGLGLTCIW